MKPTVVIDCFPESVSRYRQGYAVVAVDVIRATTTIATAVALGRRCFSAPSLESAQLLAARLPNALLAGELSGIMPPGFHMNNSPADLAGRSDVWRPLILLSSSGTKLIDAAQSTDAAYIGCFRNFAYLATKLAGRHSRIAVIGAGSRNEFREEDQMCCAWIAQILMEKGYVAGDPQTRAWVERWDGAPAESILSGHSANYLRRSGQSHDLEFVLSHIGDLDWEFAVKGDEVVGSTQREKEAVLA